jgi:hypothetical protein
MADVKGARLYVGLGPSQARKRLAGFGHGVRKVESAGRGRAVVIHTATGQHLEELKKLFADVGCSETAVEARAADDVAAGEDGSPSTSRGQDS